MGKLRRNDWDDFPINSRSDQINYILIYDEPFQSTRREYDREKGESRTIEEEVSFKHFKSTKGAKESLLSELESVDDYNAVTLLGVWPGKYSADTFVLDLPEFIDAMNEAEL
jgi:hypothetical protein